MKQFHVDQKSNGNGRILPEFGSLRGNQSLARLTSVSRYQPIATDTKPMSGFRSQDTNDMGISDDIVTYEYVEKIVENGNGVLIDVRQPEERSVDGSIPTAVNIPLNKIAEAFALPPGEIASKYGIDIHDVNDEIIFHCRSGARSQQALEIARNNGYRNVKNYKGGITEWNARTR